MSGAARWALLAACFLGNGSCGSAPPAAPQDSRASQAPTPPGALAEPSAAPPKAAAAPERSATAEQEVARALKYVSALRELAPLAPVKGRVISRDEMVAFVERDLDTEIPPAVVTASGEILFALGAVPVSFDYRRALLDVMRAELLGFYEPHEKTMFLGADLHGQELDSTLWHELVHALQDQHYGLEKLLTFTNDAGDWQSAVHALAEGDATSAMIDAMFAPKGAHAPDLPDSVMDLQSALSTGAVGQVPAIIKRSVVAPYVDGLSFVNSLRRRGGWAAVDAAWRRLPTSTEQVLHLDKYDANEGSSVLPALDPPTPDLEHATYSDIYGEETLRVLFEEWMPAGVGTVSRRSRMARSLRSLGPFAMTTTPRPPVACARSRAACSPPRTNPWTPADECASSYRGWTPSARAKPDRCVASGTPVAHLRCCAEDVIWSSSWVRFDETRVLRRPKGIVRVH
jgi:hypothetical protein